MPFSSSNQSLKSLHLCFQRWNNYYDTISYYKDIETEEHCNQTKSCAFYEQSCKHSWFLSFRGLGKKWLSPLRENVNKVIIMQFLSSSLSSLTLRLDLVTLCHKEDSWETGWWGVREGERKRQRERDRDWEIACTHADAVTYQTMPWAPEPMGLKLQ